MIKNYKIHILSEIKSKCICVGASLLCKKLLWKAPSTVAIWNDNLRPLTGASFEWKSFFGQSN